MPSERCDEVHSLKPTQCRRCGTKLTGCDTEPLRHQVWELPEIKPHVTEYQRHRLTCRRCGETTCAELPPGVPQGQSGPRLVAFSGLLMAYFRQSKRRTALFLEALLNQPCCAGLAVKMQNQVTAAVRPAYDELVAQLPVQDHLGMDESPTKEGADKAWLWTAVAGAFTVFGVRLSRAATLLEEWLGEAFTGVITCDRAKMYWSHGRLQWCWAHLKRDFQALIDSGDGKAKRLGHDLMRQTRELFRLWAALSRWHAHPTRLASLDAADPPQGRRLAAARSVQRKPAPDEACAARCMIIAIACGPFWKWKGSSRPTTPASARCVTR